MKQKLFVLGLLLTFIVNVANAWTGLDDEWWAANGYTSDEQAARQSYDDTRTYTYGIPSQGTWAGDIQTLNLTAYDDALNAINTYLGANGDQLPADTKTALQKTYNDYVAKERAALRDFHTRVFFESGAPLPSGIANRYTGPKASWDPLIAADAARLQAKLKTAKALADAKALLEQAGALPERDSYGKSTTDNTTVWGALDAAKTALNTAVTTYDDLTADDATAYSNLTTRTINLAAALAANEAANETAKQNVEAVQKAVATYEDVLANGGLTDEQEAKLTAAVAALHPADALANVTDASGILYNKIGADFGKGIPTLAAKIYSAINTAITGVSSSAFEPGLTWTYGQPLPIANSKDSSNPYTLTWTSYDAAVTTLKNLDTGIATLNSAVQNKIATDYEAKETKVKAEWTTDAFKTTYTAFTKPNQWDFNQTTWQAGIDQDWLDMQAIAKLANSYKDLKTEFEAKQLDTDKDIPTANTTLYNDAVSEVNALLNETADGFENILLNERADAIVNINKVRAQFLGAVNTIAEETTDINTAGEFLSLVLEQANIALGKMTGTATVQKQAKTDLQDAITTAQGVYANVTGENYKAFATSKDVVAAANALAQALTNAKNKYDGGEPSSPIGVPWEYSDANAWVYATPEHVGTPKLPTTSDGEAYTLIWTEYDAAQKDLADFVAQKASEVKNALTGFSNDYVGKKSKATTQWTAQRAWKDETTDDYPGGKGYPFATNWSYNQDTWQAGINADVVTMKQILRIAQALDGLKRVIAAAEELDAKSIIGDFKTPIQNALTNANALYEANKALPSIEETIFDQVLIATTQLQQTLAQNNEEIQDVLTAANLLKANITAAQALIGKNLVAEADKTGLETQIATAQAVLDKVKPADPANADFSTVNNAADVTAAYMALLNYVSELETIDSHKPTTGSYDWTYSDPLKLGEENPTGLALDWTRYGKALERLTTAQAAADDVQDATFRDITNKILAGYTGKKGRAEDDWETKAAWSGANKFAMNWSYNLSAWNSQIDTDADKIEQFVELVESANTLYNLIGDDTHNAKKLYASTEILGAYKQSLKDAIENAEAVYKTWVTDNIGYVDAGHSGDSYDIPTGQITTQAVSYLNGAIAQLQYVIAGNTEETEDVLAAAEILNHAIKAAKAAAIAVEDIDGGDATQQYTTIINNLIDSDPNYQKLYDNAKGLNFTETDFEVANSETLIAAANALKEAVNATVAQYMQGITNINNVTTVDWAYAEPLRLGDNQDPAPQDVDGNTKYTLDWTKFDAALKELKNTNITASEVLNIRDTYVVPAMETKEATAKDQWYKVPAWTGTNDKFVNQFQYNQTTWQAGINQDVAHIQNATKVFATLNALDAQIKEAETFIASEAMLQAPYLKDALQDAIDAAKTHYAGMTDGSIDATELTYATTEAISIGLKDARDAVAEETKSVKTVQPLLNSAIQDAMVAKTTVENVDGGKAFADNIQAEIDKADALLKNAQDNKFLTGDIKYAKTLTNAIRDLNKVVRDNIVEYNASIDNIAPATGDWVYAQPLRLGKEKDPVAQDAEGNTVYTLDWTSFNKALSELTEVATSAKNKTLRKPAMNVVTAFTEKQQTANTQWTSVEAWEGINDKYVNQYQYNETTWNLGIENDAKILANVTDLVIALDSLYSCTKYAKDNLNPAADNANVVSTYATAMQAAYDNAYDVYKDYIAKLENADATRYDVQVVDNATNTLKTIMAINADEIDDIDEYRPALWESYKVAQDIQKKIKDAAWTECYDKLGQAIADAKKVFDNANNHLYNEFKNAQEVTIARRALVLEMVKQQNAYVDTINGLKDTLQQTIEDARAASLVVSVHNTYSTDLQNEIAAAYGMMSADPMLLPEDTQDLNLTKLQKEIIRLKRFYCSAFILDLDSLKAAIADAEKFYNGVTPFVSYKGVEKAKADIKTAIDTAKDFLADAEAKNASQSSTTDPYNPTFTDAAAFNTYNTVDVPAATDALNKAHMAINLAALKAVSDSIKSYVDNEKVVTLYQNALNQVIDHANSVYGQYQPSAEEKTVFSNFETQDKITGAIVTAIGDAQKFYAANDDAIAEAETVRTKLAAKIADATTLKGELKDATSKDNLQTAITTATTLKDTDSASPEELTNGITALDLAMRTARWTDDIARLTNAISTKEQERETLTDPDAKEIMALYINKAQALLAKLQTSVNTTVTTAEVSAMITELGKGLIQAQTYNNGEMLPDLLGKAKAYKDLIPTEYQEALEAQEKADAGTATYPDVKAKGQALAEATAKAEAYTLAKNQLQTAIDEAKLAEEQSADYKQAVKDAETAVAAAFTQDQDELTNIINDMDAAYNALKTQMNGDRWSHQALGGKMIVKPWKANEPRPGQAQYIKLAGKYTSADAEVANNSVDLFITNIQGTAGTRTFDWAPFTAETDYKASIINLTSVGVSDFNNFKKYGWSYDEHYNDIIIKAGAIYSSGDGFVNANHAYGPFTWTNVWNQNDLDILDKDADGLYYGRYYTYKWSETNEGGVYRVPSILGIYDDTEDQFKVNGIKTYISKPNEDGSYFINSDLVLEGDKGYDTEATVFNYENGTAILNGRWHRVQFIDRDQFLYHQAAQKAADWYNNNPDLRHYDTAALAELKKAVESDNNKWETDAIEEAMKKVLDSYNKVNMIKGDNKYGVIATGDYADVQRTYTVTGAPDDAIDAKIIAQTENWTKDDAAYWQIVSADEKVGADSTATIVVKFNPGNTYPADYREYQAILDVKVGNLNYQDEGKSNLQQAIYGANPKLSLKEADLLQTHSLNLHRKDSITYDLYGRGYAHLYEKSPLKATFYDANDEVLATSEVKTTLVKSQFTAYGEDVDQTKFTVAYYPENLGVDVVKVVISDTIRTADDIVLTVNACKSEITFDPATVTDANQNSIKLEKMADKTEAYFYPADGETYFFPIAISNFDGVNANTKVVNEDDVISITTDVLDEITGLVVEHTRHDVQITIDNRDYFTVETATTEINGTSKNIFVISVKTNKLEQGTLDDGQHDGLLQIIWQDQDTIKIHLNQTLPWFDAPETATELGPIVDSVDGNIEWEFTEDGDKIWYVDVNDVENYYSFNTNFGAYTNTDWFIVNPSINYQLTDKPGTRKYRLKITYNPHEVNTVYTDVLTLNIFDTKRNVIVATTSINLKGDGVASIKGNGGATAVENAEVVEKAKKDGKYFKDGKLIIVKGNQEFEATGAQTK